MNNENYSKLYEDFIGQINQNEMTLKFYQNTVNTYLKQYNVEKLSELIDNNQKININKNEITTMYNLLYNLNNTVKNNFLELKECFFKIKNMVSSDSEKIKIYIMYINSIKNFKKYYEPIYEKF